MPSSRILRRVALVRTDISEERSASVIKVTRFSEVVATLAVTINRRTLQRMLVTANVVPISPILVTLMMEELSFSLTRFLHEPHGVTSQNTAFSWLNTFQL
jgi:hypothetical protein